jgi:DNA-binding SARP family transcriptional activator
VEFRILGPVEVLRDGRPLALGGPKQRTLLAALLLRPNQVVSVDELSDALWGERAPERATKSLQVYVWQLRKLLGHEILQTRSPGYALRVESGDLDLHRFESLCTEARGKDPAEAAVLLRDALALFRGRPLADFAYERFAGAEVARIEELRLQALESRIEADLALGRHAALVGEVEALVAEHPLRERLRSQLMLALYRCGRQAEALAAYQEARRLLVEELGIEPSRELQTLQTAILRHDIGLDQGAADEVTAAPGAEPVGASEPPPRREERKLVTVLVAALRHDAAGSARADPEDVRTELRSLQATVTREIESRGGTVQSLVGESLAAVFGARVAHEDDAERAVRAALAIRDAIAEDADQQAWVGVDTGVALVSLGTGAHKDDAIAAGNVVSAAQQLQVAAPVNGVLVGAQTYRATRDVIAYRPAPSPTTGEAEGLTAWEALEASSRLGLDSLREPRTPLVGRQRELDLVVSALARVREESSAQLVTLIGVPGIGKSRLVFELFTKVEQEEAPITWRRGRCLPYGEGVSLWALGEIVKAQAGILESDSPDQAGEKLSAAITTLVEDASEREWFKTRLAPLVGFQVVEDARAVERAESFTAWRRFLEALADTRPLVLVFEDVHWADGSLLDFVDELADRVRDAPMLIVCTARPELLARRPGWGGGKPNTLTISLPALSAEETASLVASVSDRPLQADARETLLERAAGNPLYAEQFARVLAEAGALEELPETVHGIIAARLDGLLSAEKTLLQDAAVLGTVFWLGALQAIGGVSRATAEELLHGLERKEFVRLARRSSIAQEAEYVFRHVLLRDVAYDQIPRPVRAAKHRTAAEWIERIAAVTDHAEILAHHYAQAVELFRAAGEPDEAARLETPLRRFLVMAGDRAFHLNVARAESYYGRALALVPPGHPERATVLTKTADAAWVAGRLAEAQTHYESAIAELRAAGNAVGVGEAMVSLSVVHTIRGEPRRAQALLNEAVALLERETRGPELARAYALIARAHLLSEEWAESLTWSEQALHLAEELDMKEVTVMALQFRGQARSGMGDLGGLDDLREALQTGQDFGLGLETARVHLNIATVVWLADGPAEALEVQRAGIDFGDRHGIASLAMWIKAFTLWTLFDLGAWEELVRIADELISWDHQHGGSYFGVMALSCKAQVLLRRGRLEEAASLSEEFLPRARKIEHPQVLGPALAVTAMIEQAKGNGTAAVELVEEYCRAAPSATLEGGTFDHEAVRLCAATGSLGIAERLLEGRSATLTRHRHGLLTGRAILAEVRGELDEAVRLFAEAAQGWGEYGFVLERAQALLGLGRSRLALGAADATSPLTDAREVFARLRARPLAAATDELLAKVPSTRS